MKKNIGSVLGLYPTPVTVVGTEVDGKVNWLNICHVGIVGMDKILLSIDKPHYSIKGIKAFEVLSVNLVSPEMLVKADFVGIYSGKSVDKSEVFEYFYSDVERAPLITESPISMACRLIHTFETDNEFCFILDIIHTFVAENCLDEEGKIDFIKVNPVLFEAPHATYLSLGKPLAKCWDEGLKFN